MAPAYPRNKVAGAATRVGPNKMRIEQRGNMIRVYNKEIILSVDRLFTGGVAPAASQYKLLGFRDVADTGSSVFGNNTWLGRQAGLFDRFRFKSAEMEFVPSLPFTFSGQVGITYDADWNGSITQTFPQLSGQRFAKTSQVSQPAMLSLPGKCFNRLPWYDTSSGAPSDGDSINGIVRVVTTQLLSPVANSTPTTINCGFVWLDYVVEFDLPSNPASQTVPALSVSGAALTAPVPEETVKDKWEAIANNWQAVEDLIKQESVLNSALQSPAAAVITALTTYIAATRKLKRSVTPTSVPTEGGVLQED